MIELTPEQIVNILFKVVNETLKENDSNSSDELCRESENRFQQYLLNEGHDDNDVKEFMKDFNILMIIRANPDKFGEAFPNLMPDAKWPTDEVKSKNAWPTAGSTRGMSGWKGWN